MPVTFLPSTITALPCWSGTPTGERLNGGLSNEIWKVTDDTGPYVVRLGRDYPVHHVSRAREALITRAAHAAGFAPAVEYTAPGVMVTQFITAQTLTAADLQNDPARVATLLRRFHTEMPSHISGDPPLFWVFHVIRDYARTLATSRHTQDLPEYLGLSAGLEAAQIPLPLIFGHNDLLPANILDDGNRLWLIDYEYAGFSTALFDLAGAASNAGMNPDQSNTLLTTYFGTEPSPAMRKSFAAMQCASLLREAMWAMVSEIHLNAPGVDYAAYASENIQKLNTALADYQSRYGPLAP
jgi:thiamine kinase-like enzyme